MSTITAIETSIKMVLFDAIEKGLTSVNEACAYMKTEQFQGQVLAYKEMLVSEM